jgi:hypothetical protein
MRASTFVLAAAAGAFVVVVIALSCAQTTPASCDPTDCSNQCMVAGHPGGDCQEGACICTANSSADADAIDVIDTDTRPEVADETTVPDVADDADRPDDVRDEGIRPDIGDGDGDGMPEGDAKSGCDPLICFMSCGGSCSVGGSCVCPPPSS